MSYEVIKVSNINQQDTLIVTADNGTPVEFKILEVVEYATLDTPLTEIRTDKGVFETIENDTVILKKPLDKK